MNDSSSSSDGSRVISETEVRILRILLVVATALFLAGIFLPMITISQFIVIESSFSVISGVIELLRNGQYLLFIVVAAFSIVLPMLKIAVLFRLLSVRMLISSRTQRYLKLMHDYGRWAMLDVMVVAVLVVTVKLGAIASIEVHYGLYIFGLAVLLIMIITNRIVRLTGR